MKSVREVSQLTGVSVRTLHYYDEIGLLPPDEVTEAGYRLYGERALSRLQQILFFRELRFPLREIKAILSDPSFDEGEALRRQRELLLAQRRRLDGLLHLLDQRSKGENNMSFQEFDMTEIERARVQYADETRRKWGNTDAYRESERRAQSYEKEDWQRIQAEADEIWDALAAEMGNPPDSPRVQALVRRFQAHVTEHYYHCTDEILAGLGEMYLADERFQKNLDRRGAGFAAFLSQAFRAVGNC